MKNYSIRKQLEKDERKKLNTLSDFTSHLLFHRNIKDNEKANNFLNPHYKNHTHDPFLLKDAEKSAKRIIQAIESNTLPDGKKENIVIYSDYDADGIPAGVIFHDFFKKIGFKNFINYIPHRHDDGFGLNTDAVNEFIKDGVNLLITLDCGITDIEAVKMAQENGIDVIITDHHEPPIILPPAFAIVNHKQKDCDYPEKILCGSGVALKLIQAILKINRFNIKEGQEKWFLDMVGLATLSDMVPLIGENRVFASYGLKVLKKSPRKGLMRLFDHLKINQRNLNEDDIGFMITPRINVASRMGEAMDAFRLLATDDDDEAYKYVEHLDHINNERKGIVASLIKEVKKILSERYKEKQRNVIVIGNPEWRPSLLGLVANNLSEEFNKPAFLWGRDGDGIIKGSCRSNGLVSVVDIMHRVPPGVISQYGGHFASGGFAVFNEAIHHLEEHLNDAFDILQKENIAKNNGEDMGIEPEYIDMEITLDMVNWENYSEIEKMAPFGIGNPKPIFIFKNIKIAGLKEFGKNGNKHLELKFKKENGSVVNAVGFFMTAEQFKSEDDKPIQVGDKINLIANIEKSTFGGKIELRLRIVDVV